MIHYRAAIKAIKHRARKRYCMAMLARAVLGGAYAVAALPIEEPAQASWPKSAQVHSSDVAKPLRDRNACGLKPGGVVVVLPVFIVGSDADGQAVYSLGHIGDPVCTWAI
jgi:hypothetical protein